MVLSRFKQHRRTVKSITVKHKLLAIVAHLAWFAGGVGTVWVALLIAWLFRQSPFVRTHARQAAAVQLVFLLLFIAGMIVGVNVNGVFWVPYAVGVWGMLAVSSVWATWYAWHGQMFRYPLIGRLPRWLKD